MNDNQPYYTENGGQIRNPTAYAKTGSPMFSSNQYGATDLNQETAIYKLDLEGGKKYIGKTTDIDRRMDQHFSGNGSKVTQKFKPIEGEVIDVVPGFLSDKAEHEHTEDYIREHGYENVRGGHYVNSKTLHKNKKPVACYKCGRQGHTSDRCYAWKTTSVPRKTTACKRCGRSGHIKSNCYAKTHAKGYNLYY